MQAKEQFELADASSAIGHKIRPLAFLKQITRHYGVDEISNRLATVRTKNSSRLSNIVRSSSRQENRSPPGKTPEVSILIVCFES